MSDLLSNLFGVPKPVIAMAHFGPLPGSPLYDTVGGGVDALLDALRRDVDALLAGGVDAVLFCNEADRPYALKADLAAVATMSRIIAELRPRDRPFGVDFLWDPEAALCMAAATGAAFMREVVTGVYESDMGSGSPTPPRSTASAARSAPTASRSSPTSRRSSPARSGAAPPPSGPAARSSRPWSTPSSWPGRAPAPRRSWLT